MKASDYRDLGIKPYKKGLCDLGNNIYCYLQPDGGWGWSNAGLIKDGKESLIVDTLFDERLTYEMLEEMRKAIPVVVINSSRKVYEVERKIEALLKLDEDYATINDEIAKLRKYSF